MKRRDILGGALALAGASALRVTPAVGSPIAGDVADPLYSGWINVLTFESGLGKPVTIGGAAGPTARSVS